MQTMAIPYQLKGEVLNNAPLARYTSWRVGGAAEELFKPADVEDLQYYLSGLEKDQPITWLGLGSNVLIRDGGIKGSVIYTRGCLPIIEFISEDELYVEAGVPCAHVAKQSVEKGLSGAEFLAGIPGTMGGALTMNAGAFGGEVWDIVSSVVVINKNGELKTKLPNEFDIAYRSVNLKSDEWFVSATLKIPMANNQQGKTTIRELLAKRSETQPTNLPSGGSVFKNPKGDYAARLIEQCGLKGFANGNAQVSEKHANFIVNNGGATASQIEALIEHVRTTVLEQQGVALQTEVRIIGERANHD